MPKTGTSLTRRDDVSFGLAKEAYDHVIALIPGIRDVGDWQQVENQLRRRGVHVVVTKRSFFSAFEFLFPINLTERTTRDVIDSIQSLKDEFPNAKISVIAHSFGTYVFQQVMRKDHNLRVWKVVCCGSVVDNRFQWSEFKTRIGDGSRPTKDFILNDCGSADFWPILGASFGLRYGIGGVTGFPDDCVTNRFHECYGGGHGLFFHEEFVAKYWKGYLLDDEPIKESNGKAASDLTWLLKNLLLAGVAHRAIQLLVIGFWLLLLCALLWYSTNLVFGGKSVSDQPIVVDSVKISLQQLEVGVSATADDTVHDVGTKNELAFQVTEQLSAEEIEVDDFFRGSALFLEFQCKENSVIDRIELYPKVFQLGLDVGAAIDGSTNKGPPPDWIFWVDTSVPNNKHGDVFSGRYGTKTLEQFTSVTLQQGKNRLAFVFSRDTSGRGIYELAVHVRRSGSDASTRVILVENLELAFFKPKGI